MLINAIYDAEAQAAPQSFRDGVQAAINILDTTFAANITLNIDISYGEIGGLALPSQQDAESQITRSTTISYSQLRADLIASSNIDATSASLPNTASVEGHSSFVIASAQEKLFGILSPNDNGIDGTIGFGTDLASTTPGISDAQKLIGVALHEITETMGRVAGDSLDLFRFADSDGSRVFGVTHPFATNPAPPAYFSIDGGQTKLMQFDLSSDPGDWLSPPSELHDSTPPDPFYANGPISDQLSAVDITVMEALGFSELVPVVTSLSAVADTNTAYAATGHLVTVTMTMNEAVTVTGSPTLQLSDNEVAAYTGGSGSKTLSFSYTVQAADNTTDLQVTGLNLPSGAAITDQNGNTLSGSVTGDLTIQINTTSVQQEILGLYAALYGRAAEFPGFSYWIGVVGQQSDGVGVTVANAGSTEVTLNDAAVLGQAFVNTQSTYFNSVYGSLNDSQFINALYVNIGGNAGDPTGIAYWASLLQQAEGANPTAAQIQAARAGLVGQFVHDLVDYNLSTATGLTAAQLLAATQRQGTIDNKIAVSLAYSNASQQTGGAILDPQTIGDAAYQAATTILQNVTYDSATVTAAITGINAAVAAQNLHLI